MKQSQSRPMSARSVRGTIGVALAASLSVLGLTVLTTPSAQADVATNPPAFQSRDASAVTSDALPTVQIDSGVVWSQAIVGNTVYAGGSFSNARPAGAAPGTNLTPRANLLAYDITSGKLITSFAPQINGVVKVVRASPDGTRLYVGGTFTTVDATTHYNVAAFSTATGKLITGFKAQAGGSYVNAIAATNTAVYVGGLIGAGNGVTRKNLAAFDIDGKLLGWAPVTDLQVDSMVIPTPADKLVIAGRFTTVNNVSQRGMAALSLTDGSMLPWAANATVKNGGPSGKAGIYSVSADGNTVYGTGWVYADHTIGNLEGSFAADPGTGAIRWVEDCHGDTYDSFSDGTTVYTVSHKHDCSGVGGYPQKNPAPGNMRHAQAFTAATRGTLTRSDIVNNTYTDWSGSPAPAMVNWFPDFVTGSATGQGQAAWDITGNGSYVVAGGEFPYVNGQQQQGLVRFAKKSISGAGDGPRLAGNRWAATAISVASGRARVSAPQNYDRDSLNLTYELRRTGVADPIYTTRFDSPFWKSQPVSYTDSGLTPGQAYTYQWSAVDPDGNVSKSAPVTVTVSSAPLSKYASDVLADNASQFWRLDEGSGSTGYDFAGAEDLTVSAGVTRGVAGATGDSDAASTFNGQATGLAVDPVLRQGPDVFGQELWFRTTATSGGKLLGLGDRTTGGSGNYDRHVYMEPSGRVTFGVYNGRSYTITSPNSLNDGQWHYVATGLSGNGMVMYVDGKRIGTNSGTTIGQNYAGYWRVGGDTSWSGNSYFRGDIDDVAIYPGPLNLSQVQTHYQNSGRSLNLPGAPSDRYGKAVFNDSPDLYWRADDASGPTAADASINRSNGVYSGGVDYRVASPVTGANGTAVNFQGTNGTIASSTAVSNPSVYSEELWFNTTTTSGGKLIGFGNRQSGTSTSYDRHVYMNGDGTLTFGTYTGQLNLARSSRAYNDGQWHHLVATQGPKGMVLYVDGASVATNPQMQAEGFTGYWRVGGDSAWEGVQPWFRGAIDEVAVYSDALSPAQVLVHYRAAASTVNAEPSATFSSSATYLEATFDASGSSDTDGTIASYAWNFGDGTTGTGVNPVHTYTAAGSYTVTLTVTDDGGATKTVTSPITVAERPNAVPTAVIDVTTSALRATFSGGSSTDSDGTIASYRWDFGDSTSSTEVSPVHDYAATGKYSVTLTVTDDRGATGSTSRDVTVTAPNRAPTASFTASNTNLVGTFDASASSDPDGTVASYAWDFGDTTATGSGQNPSHTYTAAGTYQVTLTVTDDNGATGSVTRAITVTAANAAPSAAFSYTVSGQQANFDGSGSTDADGSVASYRWDFGDSTAAGSGVKPSHSYAPGTYTVTLTVTDDGGAQATTTRQVTIAASALLATDAFGRSTTSGWGSADTGGAWTTAGTASNYNVDGSRGRMTLRTAGASPWAVLSGVSAQDVQSSAEVSFDSVPTGGGSWAYLLQRQSSSGNYQLAIKVLAGTTTVYLRKLVGSTTTTLAQKSVTMNYAAGDRLRMSFVATGGSPTTLSGKFWKVGQPEPTGYQVTATDSESALQSAGRIGIQTYLSGSATILPVVVSVDDFDARRPA